MVYDCVTTLVVLHFVAAMLNCGCVSPACFGIDLVSSMDFGGETEAELSVVNVVADLVRVRVVRVVAP